jgi:hypothetical protein
MPASRILVIDILPPRILPSNEGYREDRSAKQNGQPRAEKSAMPAASLDEEHTGDRGDIRRVRLYLCES